MKNIFKLLLVALLLKTSLIHAQPFGSTLKLDGSNDYANQNNSIIPDRHSFTIETWFFSCNQFSTQYIFDARNGTSGYGVQARFTSSGFTISLRDSVTGTKTMLPSYGLIYDKWNHFAFVHNFSDSMNYVFINGTAIDSVQGLITPAGFFTIGKPDHTTSDYFTGYIDDFRISDTARFSGNFTPSGTPLPADFNTLSLWSFNDTEGSATIQDSTTNNYDLTGLMGAVTRIQASGSASADVRICFGDTAYISTSGGTSYLWVPPFYLDCDTCALVKATPVSDFEYRVIITTDSLPCPISDTVIVFVDTIPQISISGDTSICNGQAATLTAMGANSYIWNTSLTGQVLNASPTIVTNYFVIGTDGNNCSDTAFWTVSVNSMPDTSVTDIIGALKSNDTASTTTYQWIDCNNGNAPIAGATTQIYTPAANGRYAVIVDNGVCSDTSGCHNFVMWSISEFSLSHISLFPNPAGNELNISVSSSFIQKPYEVLDNTGRLVHKGIFKTELNHISLAGTAPGIYILKTDTGYLKFSKL